MYKYMSHTNDVNPRGFWMTCNKFLSEHICSFSDYFNVLNHSIKQKFVIGKIIYALAFHEFKHVVNGFLNMQKSVEIFNFLSHISNVCRD